MSLIQNIDHLFTTRGIDAVVVQNGVQLAARGDAPWTDLLAKSLELRDMAGQDTLRITLDTHSIVVQCEGAQVAAVVIRSGDPVAKSLKRMIRRMGARVRPPVSALDQDSNPIPTGAHSEAVAAPPESVTPSEPSPSAGSGAGSNSSATSDSSSAMFSF